MEVMQLTTIIVEVALGLASSLALLLIKWVRDDIKEVRVDIKEARKESKEALTALQTSMENGFKSINEKLDSQGNRLTAIETELRVTMGYRFRFITSDQIHNQQQIGG